MNNKFLYFFIARRIASDMDRQGVKPPLLVRIVVGMGLLSVAGFVLALGLAVLDFIAWHLGLI